MRLKRGKAELEAPPPSIHDNEQPGDHLLRFRDSCFILLLPSLGKPLHNMIPHAPQRSRRSPATICVGVMSRNGKLLFFTFSFCFPLLPVVTPVGLLNVFGAECIHFAFFVFLFLLALFIFYFAGNEAVFVCVLFCFVLSRKEVGRG